jgi:nucleoside-diphosphate-sugar epimerase
MKILLTGATGFLGYNIALALQKANNDILCLKRASSVVPFTKDEASMMSWVNFDDINYREIINSFHPQVLIHAAWIGVSAKDRDAYNLQRQNVEMANEIMCIFPFQQIIMLGSQDEYGYIDSCVSEDYALNPLSAYAKAKIECCNNLMNTAAKTKIEWQWLRIFSVYGLRQAANWVIPATVLKCLRNENFMDTTKGEQSYAFLYSSDLADAIVSVVGSGGNSGIYNLSSQRDIQLKDLFLKIKELTHSSIKFNFGAIDYRPNQSMLIKGDSTKFIRTFGNFEKIGLDEGLKKVVDSYMNI